jgi:N-methylhydantoinase B
VLAEGSNNLWITQFNGWKPDGQRFSMLFFNAGGMGARPEKDGLSSTAFPSGVQGTPAEIVEARSPLLFVKRELRTDSGGAGTYRGGLGHWLVLKGIGLDRPFRFSPFFDRTVYPAQGYGGGLPGAPGEYWLEHSAADVEKPNPKATVWVDPEVEIVIGLPGGGGAGGPLVRDPQLVRADVLDELVSREMARDVYGVVLDAALEVDAPGTAAQRARLAHR